MFNDIKKTILNSIKNVIKHKIIIIKTLVMPITVTSAMLIFQSETPSLTYMILTVIAQWIIYTMLAVTIHRIILLGPNSVSDWGLYIPGSRELDFFFHSFLIGLIMIPIGITTLIPGIGFFIAAILAVYVIGRVSLVFPSIATDDPLAISDSWNSTQSYQILMLVVVAIFPIVLSVPELIISKIPNAEIALILTNTVSLITMVFIVAALSESYRLIEGQFIED